MTAKEYLSEIQKYRRLAESLAERAEELRVQAEGMKAITYDKDRVQVSVSNHSAEIIAKLVDVQEEYAQMIMKFHRAAAVRSRQIADMDNADYAEILRLRYIETDDHGRRLSLEDVARRTHRSYDRTKHMHGEALQSFEAKFLSQEKEASD